MSILRQTQHKAKLLVNPVLHPVVSANDVLLVLPVEAGAACVGSRGIVQVKTAVISQYLLSALVGCYQG